MQDENGLAQYRTGNEDCEYLGVRLLPNVAIDFLSSFLYVFIWGRLCIDSVSGLIQELNTQTKTQPQEFLKGRWSVNKRWQYDVAGGTIE